MEWKRHSSRLERIHHDKCEWSVSHWPNLQSYNQNLWMHHLNGDAAYLPV
jgi:hypothetical protein